MIVVILGKFRKKPTKEMMAEADKLIAEDTKEGVKFLGLYWTLGRYDIVAIAEAPDEKSLMKRLLRKQDFLATETLVALKREDAVKLVE